MDEVAAQDKWRGVTSTRPSALSSSLYRVPSSHDAQGFQKYAESQTIATQSLEIPLAIPEGMEIDNFVKMGNMQLKLHKVLGLR